jgi:hydroxymethylpyrimidine pyrophosphatase-like HAD family hydrolase
MWKLKEIKKNKLVIFDLDDTLIKTDAKIKIISKKTGKVIKELTPAEFNFYSNKISNHFLNFDDFECPEILKRARFIRRIFNRFKKYYSQGIPVSIVTARSSSELVRDFLLSNGIDVHPDLVIAINDPKYNFEGSISQRKQKAISDLIDSGYTDLIFFDDNHENLNLAKEIEGYKNSKIKLVKVD